MTLFATGGLRWRRDPPPLQAAPASRVPAPGRPAVFIELDSLLGRPLRDEVDPASLQLEPAAADALALLGSRGFTLLAVTNQSGLARGHFTRAQFARLQAALERLLREAADVRLADVLVCPHAPGAGGAPSCLCRMPAPGLLMRAARCHEVDLGRSWLLARALDAIEAGRRAGCRALLLSDAPPDAARRTPLREPDVRCDAWQQVAAHLVTPTEVPAP